MTIIIEIVLQQQHDHQ